MENITTTVFSRTADTRQLLLDFIAAPAGAEKGCDRRGDRTVKAILST